MSHLVAGNSASSIGSVKIISQGCLIWYSPTNLCGLNVVEFWAKASLALKGVQ